MADIICTNCYGRFLLGVSPECPNCKSKTIYWADNAECVNCSMVSHPPSVVGAVFNCPGCKTNGWKQTNKPPTVLITTGVSKPPSEVKKVVNNPFYAGEQNW